ncbi:unnamed protein product [Litomosoides sigmodontis]|uniref:Uncharacterized protein n=1 Tax=Litomosoides sigmodontis TaxID=42156 RepID=A0A3P6TRX7_LITSI|nr:unnamed protein product [Litomosoides sigmodontis]
MQQDSESQLYNLQNAYDNDLTIIPEAVDSALAHFFMKQLWKPMSLEIRIVPEIQNRRNMTLVMGDKESMRIDKNKYLQPCVCKRQLEEEIQKLRLHIAFDEIRKRWRQVYEESVSIPYEHDVHMHMTDSSTSTAKPIATAIRRSLPFYPQSHISAIRSSYSTSHRSSF